MPAATHTSALVSRMVDYGEWDRVCTLLTEDLGKIAVLAKGARRSRRRFGGALGLFTEGEATLRRRGRGMALLERFDAREDLAPAISADVVAIAHGSYMLEVARELCPDEQGDPALYRALLAGLRALAKGGPDPLLLRAFELHLLRCAGVVPSLSCCARCGDDLGSRQVSFSIAQGGALCSPCHDGQGEGLAANVRLGLVRLLEAPLEARPAAERQAPGARAMRDLMIKVIRHTLGKDLQSLQFINQLRV